ncbi:MAG: sugar nucleotide-binding protein [Paucimonas sp.]|nr:sugar nucleotide-binding protein [Paucimonas sp.]
MKNSPVSHASGNRLELWGGLECTVVRIGDEFRNQCDETGHSDRLDDIDRIAGIGIRRVRYPVLWETVAPQSNQACNWAWHDERLERMRALGVAPIAGLVHHGSGPSYTDLMDKRFPKLLAEYALMVAERYPWIDMYTPVNEPLTTARFSGLYGHWYPHKADVASMLRALVNQCLGVVYSMRAIRSVNPSAKLLQTEDMGKAFSTPELQYQADYENERRWLSLDLLSGRVRPGHSWFTTFLECGIGVDELNVFVEEACTPDIIGINHYLTSERYLDHRLQHYPEFLNASPPPLYADVQAVRAELPVDSTGPEHRLQEVWDRYEVPLVISEAHHGGPRDEQLRWLRDMWNAARNVQDNGGDVRAVTVWSMFGCVDWNTLLTQKNGFYESGLFDVRCAPPRPTALAKAAAALAADGRFDHAVIDRAGWWRRDKHELRMADSTRFAMQPRQSPRRLLITGGTGTLGQGFARTCAMRSIEHDLLTRSHMDITDELAVQRVLAERKPWAVINAAGYVRVDNADQERERCIRENAHGAEILARACAQLGIPYVTFSSDLVFDGSLGRPYVESDEVSPVCTYGLSKAEAERRVADACPQALVVRTSAFFGPWDRYNFVHNVLRRLSMGEEVHASDELMVSPTYVPDLAYHVLELLIDGATGVWHLANRGQVSWHELALAVARQAGVNHAGLIKASGGRKGVTALTSERGLILPPLENAIERFVRECCIDWQERAAA